MAVTSGFFNSLNGDRRYSAEQISELFNSLINDGVFANVGTAFGITASDGNVVTVGIGRAWFNSVWVYNDAVLPVALNGSELLLDRIDSVVLEINRTEAVRAGRITVVYGIPSEEPVPPELIKSNGVYQYPLANIYRSSGASEITQSNITNMIGTSSCPYVTGILEVTNIDNIVAQWQAQFDDWMDALEVSLDENVAVTLANKILALESKFDTLTTENSIYDDLEDSSGELILDSSNQTIRGKTKFALDGEYSEHSTPVVENTRDPFKIGDIMSSISGPPNYTWRLANGERVSRDQYPALSNYIPESYDPMLWDDISGFSGTNCLSVLRIRKVNGYYVACGCEGDNAKIKYASSVNGPWTDVTIWTGVSGQTISQDFPATAIYDIAYGNGYYVLVGAMRNDSSTYSKQTAYYAWSTSLDGPWTSSNRWEFGNVTTVNGDTKISNINCHIASSVIFAEGAFYACSFYVRNYKASESSYTATCYGNVHKGTTPGVSMWSNTKLIYNHSATVNNPAYYYTTNRYLAGPSYLSDLLYVDGYLTVIGKEAYWDASNSYYRYSLFASSVDVSNFSGNWDRYAYSDRIQTVDQGFATGFDKGHALRIFFINEHYYITGCWPNVGSNFVGYTYVMYAVQSGAENSANSYGVISLPFSEGDTNANNRIYDMQYDGTYLYLCGKHWYNNAYSLSLYRCKFNGYNGYKDLEIVYKISGGTLGCLTAIVLESGKVRLLARNSGSSGVILLHRPDTMLLPAVSIPGVNSYIKVWE